METRFTDYLLNWFKSDLKKGCYLDNNIRFELFEKDINSTEL